MRFHGLQKLTLLDYPGKAACTLFTAGCNFRCPFCHNPGLVEGREPPVPEGEVSALLQRRRGVLEGVCISGGEPTLAGGLGEFMAEAKGLGYAVKLDTNGSRPEALERLIAKGLVDYVAMDVKNSPEKYPGTVGIPGFDAAGVERSIRLLLEGRVEYEFRTTVVRELHAPEDVRAIGRLIAGAGRYYIQPFKDSGAILGRGMSRHRDEELCELLAAAREYVPGAELRG